MPEPGAYRPIACGDWDAWELAILQRQPVRLRWQDETGLKQSMIAVPLDLITESGIEYLRVQRGSQLVRLRLDRVERRSD